jgi:predicted nucleic acid-binding protein
MKSHKKKKKAKAKKRLKQLGDKFCVFETQSVNIAIKNLKGKFERTRHRSANVESRLL